MNRRLADRIICAYQSGRGFTWKDDNGITWAFDHDRDLYCQGQCNIVHLGRLVRIDDGNAVIFFEIDGGTILKYYLKQN